jgi:pyrroline-5-carboxylate reductase
MKTAGFIGTGNMGRALAKAIAFRNEKTEGTDQEINLLLSNRTPAKAEALSREIGGEVTDNETIASYADYIFLGVKPQMMADVLKRIAPRLKERFGASCQENAGGTVISDLLSKIPGRKPDPEGGEAAAADTRTLPAPENQGRRFILVTMAAGLSMERISEMAGGHYPVIRIMPNTPAAIGEGVILHSHNDLVTDEEVLEFTRMLSAAGKLCALPEHLIDAGSSVSGCGPAFVYMFIEALADGGVACGLPRKDAYAFAAQMVAGSAKMVLRSLEDPAEAGSSFVHPGELKDAVCSPGGTTIEGVRALENAGFRSAVMEAVIAAFEKNKAFH